MSRKLSDEARAQIAEAVRIVKEDRLYKAVHGKFADPTEDDPKAPPRKKATKDPDDTGKPKRGGLWWDAEDEQ